MMTKLLLAFLVVASPAMAQDAQCLSERAAMVDTIRAYARSGAGLPGSQGIADSVLAAMERTERHRFIPGSSCSAAYRDGPVSIGRGQTISQPFIVALMTDLAAVGPGDTVLEIGTGSGYQAAILARLVRKVCTVEIIPPLAETAATLLRELGRDNVSVKVGDGYHGWPECGPFDATIVTAALGHVPQPLIDQLKTGGRLVMPLGSALATQELVVGEKIAPGKLRMRSVIPVRFVPFTRSGIESQRPTSCLRAMQTRRPESRLPQMAEPGGDQSFIRQGFLDQTAARRKSHQPVDSFTRYFRIVERDIAFDQAGYQLSLIRGEQLPADRG